MISLRYVMGFFGAALGVIIVIMMWSQVDASMVCPTTGTGATSCESAKTIIWTVFSILPIGLFFALFGVFGFVDERYG